MAVLTVLLLHDLGHFFGGNMFNLRLNCGTELSTFSVPEETTSAGCEQECTFWRSELNWQLGAFIAKWGGMARSMSISSVLALQWFSIQTHLLDGYTI